MDNTTMIKLCYMTKQRGFAHVTKVPNQVAWGTQKIILCGWVWPNQEKWFWRPETLSLDGLKENEL